MSPGSLNCTLSQIKDVNFILKHTLIRAITCLVKTPIKMLIKILAPANEQFRIHYAPSDLLCCLCLHWSGCTTFRQKRFGHYREDVWLSSNHQKWYEQMLKNFPQGVLEISCSEELDKHTTGRHYVFMCLKKVPPMFSSCFLPIFKVTRAA